MSSNAPHYFEWIQNQEMLSLRQTANASAGMTLLELIVAIGILMVLATAALPLARNTIQREHEAELRRDLREIRNAIDRYKDKADKGLIRILAETEGYPPDLGTLVKGVHVGADSTGGTGAGETVRFLRRVPIDPMTGHADWGKRAVRDAPDTLSWGGKNVFDVYSLSGNGIGRHEVFGVVTETYGSRTRCRSINLRRGRRRGGHR